MRPTPGMEWRSFGDEVIHLVAGQLAAFAGLCALRHLDLQFVGVDQIICGHAEAAAGHLLYGAAAQIAVLVALEAVFVLAAFAGVGHAADAVHGDGESLVSLLADRSEAHGAGGEALDDLFCGLDFFDWNRLSAYFSLSRPRNVARGAILIVDAGRCIPGMCAGLLLPHAVLQLADGERIEQVILAALAILIMAADGIRSVSESVSGRKA